MENEIDMTQGEEHPNLREFVLKQKSAGYDRSAIERQLLKMNVGMFTAHRLAREAFNADEAKFLGRAFGSGIRFIVDHNPFYIISALCLMMGFYILSTVIGNDSQKFWGAAVLMGIQNLYEFILIFTGIFLLKSNRATGDGKTLLFIEAFFLVDATLLSTRIFTFDPYAGLYLHLAIFILAAVKIYLMAKALKISFELPYLAFMTFEFLFLFMLPGIFAFMARTELMASISGEGKLWTLFDYHVWLMAGGILALKGIVLSGRPANRDVMHWMFVILPFFSILAHKTALNWIYGIPLHTTFAAPVLMGAAVFLTYSRLRETYPATLKTALFILPLFAILLSAWFPQELLYQADTVTGINLSPLRVILFIAALAYLNMFRVHRNVFFIIPGGFCAVFATAGYSVSSICKNLKLILPETAAGAGTMLVVFAFIFLGTGILMSFRRKPDDIQ